MARSRDPLAPQPPPNPNRGDSKAIVEAIVTAAMEVADPDTTINAIAERAGVGVASVYRYFPSKGAIYAEISRRLHRKFLAQLRVVLTAPSDDMYATVNAVSRVVVVGPEVSPELRRCLNMVVPFSWSGDSADDTFQTAIREIVTFLQARLPSPPIDLADRVFVAFSASRGLVSMAMMFPELAPDNEELIRHMTRGVMGYLFASDPPAFARAPEAERDSSE